MPQISLPQKEESCYQYRITKSGLDHGAFLTYELYPKRAEARNILLVRETNSLISSAQKPEYEKLIESIREYSSAHFRNIKNIVNRIVDEEINLRNVKVVVHRFGPVPVYVLPETVDLGHNVFAQIGIYPDRFKFSPTKAGATYKLPFISTKSEFVRSLNVGLDLMLQRYLEDVGEGMFDIENHLSLTGVFDRAKDLENTLSESIGKKLDVAIPSYENLIAPDSYHERLVVDLFNGNTDWILTAKYARQFALFFVNELYRHIGVASRSDYYLNGFLDIKNQFDSLFGGGWYKESRERINQIAVLSQTLRAYSAREYERLNDIDYDTLWTRRFIQFAQFISFLNEKEVISPTSGRVFLSYNRDVPKAEVLRAQIEDYIKQQYGDRVHLLYVPDRSANVKFKEVIKSSIWLSDLVQSVIPAEVQKISDKQNNSYLWIAREAEHGLLLGKEVVFLLEKGTDVAQVLSVLEREDMGFLSPDARVPDDGRAKKVADRFRDFTNTYFTVSSMEQSGGSLDSAVKTVINQLAEWVIEDRHEAIILGFFNQFPEQVRRTLVDIQGVVPYPKYESKKWIVGQLCKKHREAYSNEKVAGLLFNNAWARARRRSLLIDNKPTPLIKMHEKGKYSGTLNLILRKLRPDFDQERLEQWEQKLIKKILSTSV